MYVEGVRHESDLFAKEGVESRLNSENGDFDARNYELVQVFDPKGAGESKSAISLHFIPKPSRTRIFRLSFHHPFAETRCDLN